MTEPRITTLTEQPTAVVRDQVAVDAMPEFFARAFTLAMEALTRQGVQPAGPPFGYYHGMPTDTVDVEAGFPVSEPIDPGDGVLGGTLPAGRAVEALHIGPYDTLVSTYELVRQWMDQQGLEPSPDMWESYLSDPETEPDPANWKTLVVWPVS